MKTLGRGGLLAVFLAAAGCGRAPENSAAPAPAAPPPAPLVKPAQPADWCREHGVPESVCTRCNGSLIPSFKEKGDWCKEHALPESQCVACNPEVEAQWKAKAPR